MLYNKSDRKYIMRRQRGRLVKELDLQIRGPKLKSCLACVQTSPLPQKKSGEEGDGMSAHRLSPALTSSWICSQ